MKLHELEQSPERKNRKRIGRGPGSGHGGTATRGNKGQKSRAGGTKRAGFEGGQLPLYRRLPHQKGFKALKRDRFCVVNISRLNAFPSGTTVTRGLLYENGIIPSPDVLVKILGEGKLAANLTVQAHAFSTQAKEKIELAGGKVEVVS